MSNAKGLRELAYVDCPGGGQVVVDGTIAYVGHTNGPEATTILDVSDPRNPRQIARLMCPHGGVHAHKVRVKNGLMLTNYESKHYSGTPDPDFVGGLFTYDIKDPTNPKLLSFWPCAGSGVHRFTFDGRYAYISPEIEGYLGNIVMILDLEDPANPVEVGRWWAPGQWVAGGETPTWKGTDVRCHHPIRRGDRLYVSYWHGGYFILDISDMSKPKCIAGHDRKNAFPYPTHTVLPLPNQPHGRPVLMVVDEDVARPEGYPGAFVWYMDLADETNPVPISTFQLDHVDGTPRPLCSGCHQPVEEFEGDDIPFAWFSEGCRIVNVSNPHRPVEVAHFVPPVPPGQERVQSNDLCLDDRGLIYLVDRFRGLHILERT